MLKMSAKIDAWRYKNSFFRNKILNFWEHKSIIDQNNIFNTNQTIKEGPR